MAPVRPSGSLAADEPVDSPTLSPALSFAVSAILRLAENPPHPAGLVWVIR